MLNQNERAVYGSNFPDSMLQKHYFEKRNSFSLAQDRENKLIEEIKRKIIELVYYSEKQIKMNFSDYLSECIDYHYTYMANLFSKVNGNSIQQFFIATKIKRVKELLIYEALTLTEISYKLHYSSVAHLSNQFKHVTGLSPSVYLASIARNSGLLPHKTPGVDNSHHSQCSPVILDLMAPQATENYQRSLQQMQG